MATLTVDGLIPQRIHRPASIAELAGIVKSEGGSITPVGGATQLHFGNPLRRFEAAVETTGLHRITAYNPADLTIHVEAGVTLETLQDALLPHNQVLPLDPWNGTGATIGGIAATNAQGPLRAVGTIRDWIIGMTVIHADGSISKTGGRVVKNVSGYDLAKLYTGSLGSLGIIAEISFKLRAAFAHTVSAVARFGDSSAALSVLGQIRERNLQPIACEWAGPEHRLIVRFGEHPLATDWQLKNLPPAEWTMLAGRDEQRDLWEQLRTAYSSLGRVVVRVAGLPTQLGEMIDYCRPARWIAHGTAGILLAGFDDEASLSRVRQRHPVIIESAPLEVRRRIPTFGVPAVEHRLMKGIKDALDPEGRLNPGRHIDGEEPA